jgi:prophage maintenance system killer protein
MFLRRNGYALMWDDATQYALLLEIARGQHDVDAIAERLRPYVVHGV